MVWFVIGIILLIGAIGLVWYVNETAPNNSAGYFGIGLFTAILGITGICSIAVGVDDDIPTALDVYRGKTTLEITYRDSLAIDSTVVYKVR